MSVRRKATLEEAPDFRVDEVEIVWAGFKTPEEARAMDIVPHLVDYLEGR